MPPINGESSRQSSTRSRTISFRLEFKGPGDQEHPLTEPRAELRAAIAALQFIDWSQDSGHRWRSVVIVTRSEKLFDGAVSSHNSGLRYWEVDDLWLDPPTVFRDKQDDVSDSDLWKLLLVEIRRLHEQGVNVSFMCLKQQPGEPPASDRLLVQMGYAVRGASSARSGAEPLNFQEIRRSYQS